MRDRLWRFEYQEINGKQYITGCGQIKADQDPDFKETFPFRVEQLRDENRMFRKHIVFSDELENGFSIETDPVPLTQQDRDRKDRARKVGMAETLICKLDIIEALMAMKAGDNTKIDELAALINLEVENREITDGR